MVEKDGLPGGSRELPIFAFPFCPKYVTDRLTDGKIPFAKSKKNHTDNMLYTYRVYYTLLKIGMQYLVATYREEIFLFI